MLVILMKKIAGLSYGDLFGYKVDMIILLEIPGNYMTAGEHPASLNCVSHKKFCIWPVRISGSSQSLFWETLKEELKKKIRNLKKLLKNAAKWVTKKVCGHTEEKPSYEL